MRIENDNTSIIIFHVFASLAIHSWSLNKSIKVNSGFTSLVQHKCVCLAVKTLGKTLDN